MDFPKIMAMKEKDGFYQHGGNLEAAARRLGCSPAEILDFSASINPLGPPAGVRQAVMESLARSVHYPAVDGLPLVQALARHQGMDVRHVLPGNGSTELIYLLPRALKIRRALLVTPAFSEYRRSLELAGAAVDTFPLDPDHDFEFQPERLVRAMAPGTDLVMLANPGSPSGMPISPETIETLAGSLGRRTAVLVDEAFIDFCPEFSILNRLNDFPNLLVLRSLTKFFAIPGLRAGYLAGSADLLDRLRLFRIPWSVSVPALAAAGACLEDAAYRERTLRVIPELRADLAEGLVGLGLRSFPSAVNYLLVRLPPGYSARELGETLLSKRILIRECASFPPLDDTYFRVAVRTAEENGLLLKALEEIFGTID